MSPFPGGRPNIAHGKKSHAQHEKVEVIRGRLGEVVLGHLAQNTAHVVVDDEEQKKHDAGDHGAEDGGGGHALHGVGHPGTIGGGLPVPRCDDVDSVQGAILVDSGDVGYGRGDYYCDEGVVAREHRADLSCEGHPCFGEVERPRDVAR